MKTKSAILRTRHIPALLFSSLIALTSGGAFADNMPPPGPGNQGPQQGHHDQGPPSQQQHDGHHDTHRAPPEFNADQSGFARDYYRTHKWAGKPLPSGKHIYVGRPLPRGVYREPLPPEFRPRFPNRPGYETYIVGDDIVLIAIATGIVVDILVHVH